MGDDAGTDIWSMIADERRALADMLEGLEPSRFATPSLCSEWTVHDVAAHLVMPLETSTARLLAGLVRHGFNFDKYSRAHAKGDSRGGADLATVLRDKAASHFTPPTFGPEAPLTDAVVHGQDMRRPLGIAYTPAPPRARIILDLLVSPKAARGFTKKRVADGLRLEADDIGWTHGDGPTVKGSAEAVILALTGRTIALSDLDGDGVEDLRARL